MPKTPEQYLLEPYSRILTPNGDGTYTAEILEFAGCIAEGASANEAIQNLERAAMSWIAANLSHGIVIPDPIDSVDYAGKIALRLPRSYHRQASKLAERDGISLNQFLVNAIGEKIGAENLFSGLLRKFEQKLTSHINVVIVKQAGVKAATMPVLENGARSETLQIIQLAPGQFSTTVSSGLLKHG